MIDWAYYPQKNVLGPAPTKVFLAVLRMEPPRTYAKLMRATGLSRATIAKHLEHLSGAGLVAWEEGKAGTLTTTVGIAAADPPNRSRRSA